MYYIEISANSCRCKIVINGLGVEDLNAEKVGSIQYPCNTELIGTANTVAIEVMPATLDLNVLDKMKMQGCIKKYDTHEMIVPEFGTILTTFSLEQKIAQIKANPFAVNVNDLFPFNILLQFDSEDSPSFSERLTKSTIIENVETIKDWAMEFRKMLENKDIGGLYKLYEPKLHDYDIAYPDQKEPDNFVWFSNWMRNKIFPQTPNTTFKRSDLVLQKWCQGRIWEIKLQNGNPLWITEGLDGRSSNIEVFVGIVDGKIKIVR